MSERGYKGKTLAILLNGQRIAAVRAKTVTHSRTPIDRSDEEKSGWRYLDPKVDSRAVEIAVEGVATSNNYTLLRDEWLGTSFSDVSILHPDGNSEDAADGAFLQSLSYSGEHDGCVVFEASFIFSGLVTVGEIVAPILTDIDPNSAFVNDEGFQMTLTGLNFQDGAVALWEDTELTTTFVSSTSLLATIPESLLDQVGSFDIHVENPDGGESNSLAFTVSLSPVVLQTNWSHAAVYKSIDGGETWETIVTDDSWASIAYSPKLRRWVVVSVDGNIYTSDDDGETWDEQTSGITQTIMAVEWAPHFDLFIAHARHLDGSNPETFLYSEDGESWTEGALDTPATTNYASSRIVSCPEIGVAICLPQGANSVRVSVNGMAWTTHAITPGSGGIALAYSPALKLAVIGDASGSLLSSSNGIGWTEQHDAGGVHWGTWSPDREEFLFGGSDEVLSSEDGVSWIATTPAVFSAQIDHADMLWSLAFERYIGVGRRVAANTTQHTRSDDGATWTKQTGQSDSTGVVRIAQRRPLEPVPAFISSIDPDSALHGSGAFTLTVHGTGFTADSVVRWNGNARSTTFVSAVELTASISAEDVANDGTASITVFNPGAGASNAVTFTIHPDLVYATLDPDTDDATIALSNGNLTATRAASGNQWSSVRSTVGKSTGKWYWEITIDRGLAAGSTARHLHGVAPSTLAANQFPGQTASSYGYIQSNGNKFNNGSGVAYGTSYTENDVIGIALDMDAGKLWFAKNGTWQASGDPAAGTGEAFSGLSGTVYAAIGLFFSTTSAPGADTGVVTVNFGASAFTYEPPDGFNEGLYTS